MCLVLMRTTGLVEIVNKLRCKGRAGYVLHRALVIGQYSPVKRTVQHLGMLELIYEAGCRTLHVSVYSTGLSGELATVVRNSLASKLILPGRTGLATML